MTKQITTGQDSFLDIVANLVGILIILVVLVGAQASKRGENPSQQVATEEPIASQQEQQLAFEIDTTALSVRKLQSDNQSLHQNIKQQNAIAAGLTRQRHQMLMMLERIKQETKKQQQLELDKLKAIDASLEAKQIQRVHFLQEHDDLVTEIQRTEKAISAAAANASATPAIEKLAHYPNPIAKTVFTQEIHFRLEKGRLNYVPMDELISLMKAEWKVKAEKLQQASQTLETVGPIGGFRMQYRLSAQTIPEETQFGMVKRRSVVFQRFHVVPQPGLQGETIETAFAAGSDFQNRLAKMEPNRTTVSVWVYPDGFDDHRRIKNWLYEHGFQMASWPLNVGRHISGGPNGFKTSAQ